ncbi:MAG: hypothetical protein EOO50_14940 [Flavobacterium sp.]|uniref:sensor histidine kinase n=1 Tax=Flavobacterium sp. TaxID=239 RepID=UPI0011F7549A|nr:histidine kinase [Flavobacterium sp.]RZJ65134.1 MAG: hypothetical protein EOO50_14940 [Flavobacterium sp.]
MLFDLALGILIGVLLIIIVAVFCLVLIRLYINKIKTYTAALYQKDLDLQKSITQTVIETQEQVLQNISQDLHDDAGQQLTSINFQIESLRLDSSQYNTELEPVSQSIKQLATSIRNLSHSLSNQLLLGDDLIKAIETEAERLKNTGRVMVQFSFFETGPKIFTPDEKIVLYRIFQESINNILKHSGARFIDIRITTEPFSMTISDDGKGFDSLSETGKAKLGLTNMANRAAFIDHDFDIRSVPGTGTVLTITKQNI